MTEDVDDTFDGLFTPEQVAENGRFTAWAQAIVALKAGSPAAFVRLARSGDTPPAFVMPELADMLDPERQGEPWLLQSKVKVEAPSQAKRESYERDSLYWQEMMRLRGNGVSINRAQLQCAKKFKTDKTAMRRAWERFNTLDCKQMRDLMKHRRTYVKNDADF